MTEQEWLASKDTQAMLRWWATEMPMVVSPSDRKLRLFACACVRQVWNDFTDPRSREVVEVAERFADGDAMAEEMAAASTAAWAAARTAASTAASTAA